MAIITSTCTLRKQFPTLLKRTHLVTSSEPTREQQKMGGSQCWALPYSITDCIRKPPDSDKPPTAAASAPPYPFHSTGGMSSLLPGIVIFNVAGMHPYSPPSPSEQS